MAEQFYDIVDSEGNVVETAAEQKAQIEAASVVVEGNHDNVMVVDSIGDPKKELTEGEIKKLRKQYITVQHPKVVGCKHRLDLSRQPRHRNCQTCWFAWFNNHGEIVQQLDEMHTASGDAVIVQLQGKKFYHRWRQFMATVAQWKQVGEVKNEPVDNLS